MAIFDIACNKRILGLLTSKIQQRKHANPYTPCMLL